jgi:hypothetical protein
MAKSRPGENRRVLRKSSVVPKAKLSVGQPQVKAASGKNKKAPNRSGIVRLHCDQRK